jgi:hypothetical protein
MKGDLMGEETPEPFFTAILTSVRDEEAKKKVADTLARITTNLPADKALKRMESLPWTLTRRATQKNAERLVRVMERLGATVQLSPTPPEPPASSKPVETSPPPGVEAQTKRSDEQKGVSGAAAVPRTGSAKETKEKPSPSPSLPLSTPPPAPPKPPPKVSATDGSGSSGGDGFSIEPLSFGGILDRTFQISRRHFWKLLAIIGIPYLATIGLLVCIPIAAVIVGFTSHALGDVPVWVLIAAAVTVIPSVIVLVIAMIYFSQGAMIHAVSVAHLGHDVRVGGAYRFVLSRLGKYLVTAILCAIVISASFLIAVLFSVVLFFICKEITSSGWWSAITWLPLALIPFYMSFKLLLFDKVVIIEDVAYMSALKRSWDLLTGKAGGEWPRRYFTRLLVLLFLFSLISVAVAWLFQIPASIISALMPHSKIIGPVVHAVLISIGSLIGGILGAVSMVVFYYDIRSRKEGFDLRMLAEMAER